MIVPHTNSSVQLAHTMEGPMFKNIMHVGISVSDMQRSVAFYRDVLGFEVTGSGGSVWRGRPAA